MKKLLSLCILWLLAHLSFTLYDGLHDNQQTADVAIVFGNKVNPDGTLSPRLKARLDQAIALYRAQRVPHIIVSGGFGKEGFWEGTEMAKYLLSQQIPEQAISVDNAGKDSELTVRNSLEIMHQKGFQRAISVSQYFHQTRVKMLFRKAGLQEIDSSSPSYFELRDIHSLAREFVAFYVEWLK